MHFHQPKLYFRIDRSKFSEEANLQSYTYQPAESYSPNKKPNTEDNNYVGSFGRGNGSTLPVWMTRGGIDQSQLDQQHARFLQPVQSQLIKQNPQHIQSATPLDHASNSSQNYQHNPYSTSPASNKKQMITSVSCMCNVSLFSLIHRLEKCLSIRTIICCIWPSS